MRLDVYLTEAGLAESRSKAQEAIRRGLVTVNGKPAEKASLTVEEGDDVAVTGTACPFVGRGGLKLEAALGRFGVSPAGLVCADVGASTGGFTDCLLQHGAAHVYSIDAGHGQLDKRLAADPRVTNLEGLNARTLAPEMFSVRPALAVADLSFISLTLVLPAIGSILTGDGSLIALIKPQFECGRENLPKSGVVRDRKLHMESIRRVADAGEGAGLRACRIMKSPVRGGDGNEEFLVLMKRDQCRPITEEMIREAVYEEN